MNWMTGMNSLFWKTANVMKASCFYLVFIIPVSFPSSLVWSLLNNKKFWIQNKLPIKTILVPDKLYRPTFYNMAFHKSFKCSFLLTCILKKTSERSHNLQKCWFIWPIWFMILITFPLVSRSVGWSVGNVQLLGYPSFAFLHPNNSGEFMSKLILEMAWHWSRSLLIVEFGSSYKMLWGCARINSLWRWAGRQLCPVYSLKNVTCLIWKLRL